MLNQKEVLAVLAQLENYRKTLNGCKGNEDNVVCICQAHMAKSAGFTDRNEWMNILRTGTLQDDDHYVRIKTHSAVAAYEIKKEIEAHMPILTGQIQIHEVPKIQSLDRIIHEQQGTS